MKNFFKGIAALLLIAVVFAAVIFLLMIPCLIAGYAPETCLLHTCSPNHVLVGP